MKHVKLIAKACGFALFLGATSASADVVKSASGVAVTTDQGGAGQFRLVGSDTLNNVMDCLVNGCPGVAPLGLGQITEYDGQGSGQGQHQMEGSPANGLTAWDGTSEFDCTVSGATDPNGGAEANPGCQEIAPMTREMNKDVCEDEDTVNGGTTGITANKSAESLAICGDGIVLVTDNAALGQYADSAGSCPSGTSVNTSPYTPNGTYANAGKLRRSGTIPADAGIPGSTAYTIGGTNGLSGWKDVLRLLYTGCTNNGFGVLKTDGTADLTCATVDRQARCTNPVRKTLVNHWEYLVENGSLGGTDAGTATPCGTPSGICPAGANGGLRQAYRRDDSSGTTGFFLSTLGLGSGVGHRSALVSGVAGKVTAISGNLNMFCDGGDTESFLPDSISCTAGTTTCPNYAAAPTGTPPAFPTGVLCPSYGECPPAPEVVNSAPTCTPGAANACPNFGLSGFPFNVACPASGTCDPGPACPTTGANALKCRDYMRDQPGQASLACVAGTFCPVPFAKGDPLTRTCGDESNDNLCGATGRIGIVRPLVTPFTAGGVAPYPTLQCSNGKFAVVNYINASANAICPDGTIPQGGCYLPYFNDTSTNPPTKNFNCLNPASNRLSPLDTVLIDGRSFNSIVRDSNGVVQCLTGGIATNNCTLPVMAQWRQHMAKLATPVGGSPGGTIGTLTGTSTKCEQVDATRLVGCVTGNTKCTVGFAGREVAEKDGNDLQEPFRINADATSGSGIATDANVLTSLDGSVAAVDTDYVFARFLYFSAIGGFGNITTDCLARGGSATYCADEVKLAAAFSTANYDTVGGPVCQGAGFIKLPSPTTNPDMHECRSTQNAAACGATSSSTYPDGAKKADDGCNAL